MKGYSGGTPLPATSWSEREILSFSQVTWSTALPACDEV